MKDMNIRLEILYLNNLAYIDVKHEVLEDMNAHNIIVDQEKTQQMQDYLLNIKLEGV